MDYNIIYVGPVYYCDRMRQQSWLEEHGFHYIKARPDFNNLNHLVWLYKVTDELVECLNQQKESINSSVRYARK